MSAIQVCGKTTFGFIDAIRRATAHLKKAGLIHQVADLPETYPEEQIGQIDVVARCKILKAHLEDTFPQNRFSVKIARKQRHSEISITHDSLEKERILNITQMYAYDDDDDTVKIILNTFVPCIDQ